MNTRIDKKLVAAYGVADTERAFDEMLDECYSFEFVGGPFAHMPPSSVLKEVDPIAYRCGHVDWLDGECRDNRYVEASGGNHYDAKAVNCAIDEVIDEINDEIKELEADLAEAEAEGKYEAAVSLSTRIGELTEELDEVEGDRL